MFGQLFRNFPENGQVTKGQVTRSGKVIPPPKKLYNRVTATVVERNFHFLETFRIWYTTKYLQFVCLGCLISVT